MDLTTLPDDITTLPSHADKKVFQLGLQTRQSNPITKAAAHTQMTPPQTPISPKGSLESGQVQALFHNYLRAFHAFDPTLGYAQSDASALVTVCIKPGDLILVHSIHANGWADGTVLTTGERGWLPTNYCEAYDHPYLRNLLNAMTLFWDLLGANGDDTGFSTFVRQDFIRGLIAGVRYLLEHAACLHRDATLVQNHVGIRRMRKGLLADLSSLVHMAKRLQETISEPFAAEVIHVLLDELVAKAFRVVVRAVSFVDVWAKDTTSPETEIGRTIGSNAMDTVNPGVSVPTPKSKASYEAAATQPRDSVRSSQPTPLETVSEDAIAGAQRPLGNTPSVSRRQSLLLPTCNDRVAKRLSLVGTTVQPYSTSASERLAQAHDLCISNIGGFIGLHLHSRPSSELKETTRRLVSSCNSMLAIIDQVCVHDMGRSTIVREARDNFQKNLDQLVELTSTMFDFSDLKDGSVIVMPAQSDDLVSVGTSLIRSAGECVTKTRSLIEDIGDPDLDKLPVRDHQPNRASTETLELQTGQAVVNVPTSRPMTSFEKRLSRKMLPPLPTSGPNRVVTTTSAIDYAMVSPTKTTRIGHPPMPLSAGSRRSINSLRTNGESAFPPLNGEPPKSPYYLQTDAVTPARKDSVGISIAGSTETRDSTARDSGISTVSEVSTRATTPDQAKDVYIPDLLTSFSSFASTTDADRDIEGRLLQKTYASELILNKDRQVSAGSLSALVEQLTTHDAAPDPLFVSAFYITFRMFITPRELAQALISRFDYVDDDSTVANPVRLRVYNIFKGWLETYWNAEVDRDALGDIRYFALHKLKPHLLCAGERLIELTRKITAGYQQGIVAGPLVSHVGKATTSLTLQQKAQGNAPDSVITRSQLNALRSSIACGTCCCILDFDPLELARQITLLTSRIFCNIQADELLSLDWCKTDTQKAPNVRTMCFINTDLAHVVGDTILAPEDVKKRAQMIKHWSKIAACCLDLNNYDSLMAIMCSINSSVVQRLQRTWEVVSRNTKERLGDLNAVVDLSRNQASLRKRMELPVAPCIPFLGIYLTDLTFLHAGNPNTKKLSRRASLGTGDGSGGETVTLINFDKYMRMAKVISHLQKFQVPYKLQPVSEMQTWMQTHLQRMRQSNDEMIVQFHRRSLLVEPKLEEPRAPSAGPTKERRNTDASGGAEEPRPRTAGGKEKLEGFWKSNAFGTFRGGKNQTAVSSPEMPSLELVIPRETC